MTVIVSYAGRDRDAVEHERELGPSRKRRRLVPRRVVTGGLAVIGAVVSAVFLSGCRGPAGDQASTSSSRSAAPSIWRARSHWARSVPVCRHRARRRRRVRPGGGPEHPHRLRHRRRQHGVGDRRGDAHRHRHRARRKAAQATWRWIRAPTPSTSPTPTTRCR